jgi:hypothetical protein
VEQSYSGPTLSWDPAGPRDREPDRAGNCRAHLELGSAVQRGRKPGGVELWLCGPMKQGLGGLAVLLENHSVVKPSMSKGFRVPKFQLSMLLYLSQGCLQCLSMVPHSQNSSSLRLCSSCHFGFLIEC